MNYNETIRKLTQSVDTLEADEHSLDVIRNNVEGRGFKSTTDFSKEVRRLTKAVPLKYISSYSTLTQAVAAWIQDEGDTFVKNGN